MCALVPDRVKYMYAVCVEIIVTVMGERTGHIIASVRLHKRNQPSSRDTIGAVVFSVGDLLPVKRLIYQK